MFIETRNPHSRTNKDEYYAKENTSNIESIALSK